MLRLLMEMRKLLKGLDRLMMLMMNKLMRIDWMIVVWRQRIDDLSRMDHFL